MSRRNPRAARFGRPYRYTAKGRPRWFVRAYRAKRWSNPRRDRRLRRRNRAVFVRILANVTAFTRSAATAAGVAVAVAAERFAAFGRAAQEVEDARRQLWQAGLGNRMEELWPEVERLHRETDLTLPEAAQAVALVAVWDGLR